MLAVCVGLAFGLLAAELALRASGVFATYSESNYGEWRDVYGRKQAGWLRAWAPGQHVLQTAEFRYDYQINGDGVRDVEHALEAAPGVQRVVVLGDSYAEGVGAERDEAWPAVLAERLARAGASVEVLDAGVSGSDPWFEVELLRQRFLRYRPDLVILALNDSDIYDTVWWGGRERFREDGTARGRPAPRSFALYRRSHLARWLLHGLGGLERSMMSYGEPGRVSWQAQLEVVEACAAAAALCAEHSARLLVLVHPVPEGILAREVNYFDAFFAELERRGIDAVDLTPSMCAALAGLEFADYAWRVDLHYNARGYAAFAQAVEPLVLERLGGSGPR